MTKEEYSNTLDRIRQEYDCSPALIENGEQLIDYLAKLEKWAEEHPIKTNRDKFKEVFGIPTLRSGSSWWDEEYKEPKEAQNVNERGI